MTTFDCNMKLIRDESAGAVVPRKPHYRKKWVSIEETKKAIVHDVVVRKAAKVKGKPLQSLDEKKLCNNFAAGNDVKLSSIH